jgi:hypothetical protein
MDCRLFGDTAGRVGFAVNGMDDGISDGEHDESLLRGRLSAGGNPEAKRQGRVAKGGIIWDKVITRCQRMITKSESKRTNGIGWHKLALTNRMYIEAKQ